ncbi:hypothetical protein [Mailhella massiliensis]|uniref:hypothetical protein n=1 Tax=Mailhella massiliensis TaxID=1903261 RepID=UPI00139021D5|nr:hypothetical protein [Mailhella massiliensis]
MLKQNYPALWRKSLTSRAGMRVFYTGSSQYHMFFCVPSEKNEGRTLRFCVSAPGRKRGTPCVFPGKEKICCRRQKNTGPRGAEKKKFSFVNRRRELFFLKK